MRVAILAWGSLIWDHRELAIAEGFKANGALRLGSFIAEMGRPRQRTPAADRA